jgi:glucose/arabinose dehydrogenase
MLHRKHNPLLLLTLAMTLTLFAGCGSSSAPAVAQSPTQSTPPSGATGVSGKARLQVSVVADKLDTVWALAWDSSGALWYTERPGRLTRLGDAPRTIAGVEERGEAGLMGLEIDRENRIYLMYTASDGNRIVRLNGDGSQTTLVRGIRAASIHDGGRLRLGPDGMLYATTGDAGDGDLARPNSGALNGRILRIDPNSGKYSVFSTGHRNPQGLCFSPDGRLFSTELGP